MKYATLPRLSSRRTSGQRAYFGERRHRIARRDVLHRHEIPVTRLVDRLEHTAIIDLPAAGLMAARDIADVKVPDSPDIGAQSFNQVPLHDLDMIEVEQNSEERTSYLAHDGERFRCTIQVIVQVVRFRIERLNRRQSVDHLEEQGDSMRRDNIVRAFQSLHDAGMLLLARESVESVAGEHHHSRGLKPAGSIRRGSDLRQKTRALRRITKTHSLGIDADV